MKGEGTRTNMAATGNTSTLDHDHHDHDHDHQLNDDASDEPFYELIKQPVHMVVVYTVAYTAVFLTR